VVGHQSPELPRWNNSQAWQGANWPHDGDAALTIEFDFGAGVLEGLEKRCHVLKRGGHRQGPCAMQAIRVLPNGGRMAGSDPRRAGWAGVY
jgi:hypothetical protein